MGAARMVHMWLYSTILTVTLLCMLVGCDGQDSFDKIQSEGELVVVSRNSPTIAGTTIIFKMTCIDIYIARVY